MNMESGPPWKFGMRKRLGVSSPPQDRRLVQTRISRRKGEKRRWLSRARSEPHYPTSSVLQEECPLRVSSRQRRAGARVPLGLRKLWARRRHDYRVFTGAHQQGTSSARPGCGVLRRLGNIRPEFSQPNSGDAAASSAAHRSGLCTRWTTAPNVVQHVTMLRLKPCLVQSDAIDASGQQIGLRTLDSGLSWSRIAASLIRTRKASACAVGAHKLTSIADRLPNDTLIQADPSSARPQTQAATLQRPTVVSGTPPFSGRKR